MNGSTNGHHGNGSEATAGYSNGNATLPQIQEALEAVHSPYSTNQNRQQASSFLEEIKAQEEAPYHGFTLASDKAQQPIVRHYALSLIEHAIRHKWGGLTEAQSGQLRHWVLQLSRGLVEEDPSYLRSKTAQLWVEIAKRSWGGEWLDMDELLVQLWELPGSVVHKEFVLFILETLSDEVFHYDDAVAVLRETTLSKGCVEIFTPEDTLAEAFPDRERGTARRYGKEGWLVRCGELLSQCLELGVSHPQYQSCAIKVLAVYKTVLPWAIPKAISVAQCVQHICKSLAAPSTSVQLASIQALGAFLPRGQTSDAQILQEFLPLVLPLYTRETVDLLRKLFEWSVVNPHEIDDEKYLFSKKFSEVMSLLGTFMERNIQALPQECDLPNIFNLFLAIAQSQSFFVSIPFVSVWGKLLRSDIIVHSAFLDPLIAPLLELCSSRLLRYENLPEDFEDPALVFLNEDVDTIPEKHVFLGNYRRYCAQVIELIVRQKKTEALYYILGKVDTAMKQLHAEQGVFSAENYSKTSMSILRCDEQFTVVEAALKGYMRWKLPDDPDEPAFVALENNLEAWCEQLLNLRFDDPIIQKRIFQLMVAFSTSALDSKTDLMLKILERILTCHPAPRPESAVYSDAVKELQSEAAHELQRLAIRSHDHLLDVYEQLEGKVNEIISTGILDQKLQTAYQTFLFTIILRAHSGRIDQETRLQKLKGFLVPVHSNWQNSEMNTAIESFGGFCELLGLNRVRDFLISRRVSEIHDWSQYKLDAEGLSIQQDLEDRMKALPLRTTKSFLTCSIDKVDKGSSMYRTTLTLWRDTIPLILPNLLKFLSHSHAFHNPANWAGLPPDMESVPSLILRDRFWQSGISAGSRDDFYARVSGTKNTMEGFASSVRGTIRTVREACYSILFSLSRLGTEFYGFMELPGPLAHSMFADAHCLSSHQLIGLLNIVRLMVDDCPYELREHFIPPVLASCFSQMDAKCSSEWEKLNHKQVVPADEDTLTEEMKEESILRQLTHTAVMMVSGFLDPSRSGKRPISPSISITSPPRPIWGEPPLIQEASSSRPVTAKEASTYDPSKKPTPAYQSMRDFCLRSLTILEPLLMFLTHAIRMRDSRCCGSVLKLFRSIIPEYIKTESMTLAPTIREYISTEVLKAAISSLHEPYFVDLQKELAGIIAYIIICYAQVSETPRAILLSLPGLQAGAVDKCIADLRREGNQRVQRALVLELLKHLKAVTISEQGRLTKPASVVRKERSKMQQEFLTDHGAHGQQSKNSGVDGAALEGLADMFGGEEL